MVNYAQNFSELHMFQILKFQWRSRKIKLSVPLLAQTV